MNALASGFVGAAALTAVHQVGRRVIPDPPRMDIVGMRALERLLRFAGIEAPEPPRLYNLTMAGDLLSNGVYYSAVGRGDEAWPRAVLLGLAAGIGAVALPEPLGLGKPPHVERLRTKLLTVAWYLTGALVAAAVARGGAPRRERSRSREAAGRPAA